MKLIQGDCIEELKKLEDKSIDAIITDPPAGIAFMGKKWDKDKGGRNQWIAWLQEIMEECNRVLKPGAHVVVWALPRTSHWTRMAIDNAGFDIRHVIDHIFSQGFPKSQNVGKKYDLLMGNEREDAGEYQFPDGLKRNSFNDKGTNQCNRNSGEPISKNYMQTKGNSQWEGFGTALKPAHEDWILARKPLSEKSIVENCIKHGTGALDIDKTRIPTSDTYNYPNSPKGNTFSVGEEPDGTRTDPAKSHPQGRFPADVIVSDDALNDGEITKSGSSGKGSSTKVGGMFGSGKSVTSPYIPASIGSKSRYFDLDQWAEKNGIIYQPKPIRKEKNAGCEKLPTKTAMELTGRKKGSKGLSGSKEYGNSTNPYANSGSVLPKGNNHPTCKSLKLMSWLITLVTKPGDTVLDPFMGSGTTGVACKDLNRHFIGIEIDKEYSKIAKARLEATT